MKRRTKSQRHNDICFAIALQITTEKLLSKARRRKTRLLQTTIDALIELGIALENEAKHAMRDRQ